MKKVLMGAAALSMMVPGAAMAADGMLGATSEVTFTATMTVNAPTGTDIQLVGLDDFAFGTVATSGTVTTTVAPMTDFICLNHSGTAASQVLVEIIQTGAAQADPFKLKAASGDNGVGLTIRIDNPVHGGGSFSQQGQTAQALELSQPGCTAGTSSSSIAHKLIITPSAISAGAATETGTLSATFTIRLSSPS